jgi:hypothetical protein
MKYKFLLLGIMIAIVLVVSGCVASFESTNNSTGGAATAGQGPQFTALRTGNSTLTIIYIDPNGASSVKGLHVVSPSIGSPDLVNDSTNVTAGQDMTITDPNLAGTIHLTLTSMVDGKSQVVLDGDVDA